MNVVIYTKQNCSYCTNAKALMASKNIGYTEMKLDEDFTRDFIVETFPSAKTFPIIVVDGFNIGGYQEFQKMLTEQTQDSKKLLNEG